MTLLTFLLMLAITARITRLIVDDSITRPLRDQFSIRANPGGELVTDTEVDPINPRTRSTQTRYQENPTRLSHRVFAFLRDLTDCPWCTSVWIGGITVAVAAATHQVDLNWFAFCGVWAALAYLTGLGDVVINYLSERL